MIIASLNDPAGINRSLPTSSTSAFLSSKFLWSNKITLRKRCMINPLLYNVEFLSSLVKCIRIILLVTIEIQTTNYCQHRWACYLWVLFWSMIALVFSFLFKDNGYLLLISACKIPWAMDFEKNKRPVVYFKPLLESTGYPLFNTPSGEAWARRSQANALPFILKNFLHIQVSKITSSSNASSVLIP